MTNDCGPGGRALSRPYAQHWKYPAVPMAEMSGRTPLGRKTVTLMRSNGPRACWRRRRLRRCALLVASLSTGSPVSSAPPMSAPNAARRVVCRAAWRSRVSNRVSSTLAYVPSSVAIQALRVTLSKPMALTSAAVSWSMTPELARARYATMLTSDVCWNVQIDPHDGSIGRVPFKREDLARDVDLPRLVRTGKREAVMDRLAEWDHVAAVIGRAEPPVNGHARYGAVGERNHEFKPVLPIIEPHPRILEKLRDAWRERLASSEYAFASVPATTGEAERARRKIEIPRRQVLVGDLNVRHGERI